MQQTGTVTLVTDAGWTTMYPLHWFRLCLHPVPRPYSYWTQLRIDASAVPPYRYWIGGAGLIAIGLGTLNFQPAAAHQLAATRCLALLSVSFGLTALLLYFYMFFTTVQRVRKGLLSVGVIRALRLHPRLAAYGMADAVQADGAVVDVAVPRLLVDSLLRAHGECEVLITKNVWTWTREMGSVIAARPVRGPGDQPSEPAAHWTALGPAQRLALEGLACKLGYPVDAVFFVLSAFNVAAQRDSKDQAEGQPGVVPQISGRQLAQFIPQHAAGMFGGPVMAARTLSAWGLRTGEDVAAVVKGLAAAGWLPASAGDKPEDFRGIDLLCPPPGESAWRRFMVRSARWRGPYRSPPSTEMRKWGRLLILLFFYFCVPVCMGFGVVASYALWNERLLPEERTLVGRWHKVDEQQLSLLEFDADREWRGKILHRGEAAAPPVRNLPGWWAVRDGRIVVTAPARDHFDRLQRAIGNGANKVLLELVIRRVDADTLQLDAGDRRLLYRRVPAGLASDADLFPPLPRE